jgi:hypothetical protein
MNNYPNAGVALSLLLLGLLPAQAQDAARDPTVAPGESTGQASPSPAGVEGMTVLVRDGRPTLVVGTRLYAPGDMVGSMRLQRITEKEVWFHDGSAVIKVPRFAGIERKSLATKPLCAAPAKRPASAVAPACDDTQP